MNAVCLSTYSIFSHIMTTERLIGDVSQNIRIYEHGQLRAYNYPILTLL